MADAHREEADRRKDPMEFVGDTDGPPLGWVLVCFGTYRNIYGRFMPVTVRRWGYVMWDENRWVELGAKHLVQQQWEKVVTLTQNIEEQHDWSFQWPESDGAWRLLSKKLEFEGSCRMNRGKYLMKRLISIYILRSGQNLYTIFWPGGHIIPL